MFIELCVIMRCLLRLGVITFLLFRASKKNLFYFVAVQQSRLFFCMAAKSKQGKVALLKKRQICRNLKEIK